MPWIEIDDRRKRWQPDPGERYVDDRGIERTRSRRRPKPRQAAQQYVLTPAERQDEKAIDYAIWLARRDGIELPEVKRRGIWSRQTDPIQIRVRAERIDVLGGKRERRVRRVEWCRMIETTTSALYDWIAPGSKADRPALIPDPIIWIDIPHWDHVPTVEEVKPA